VSESSRNGPRKGMRKSKQTEKKYVSIASFSKTGTSLEWSEKFIWDKLYGCIKAMTSIEGQADLCTYSTTLRPHAGKQPFFQGEN